MRTGNSFIDTITAHLQHSDASALFYNDGAHSRTWVDAYLYVRYAQSELAIHGIKPGASLTIGTTKSFEKYALMLACFLNGITYCPADIATALPDCDINAIALIDTESSVDSVKNHQTIPLKLFKDVDASAYSAYPVTVSATSDSVVYTLASSGSTGTPKLIPISNGNLSEYIRSINLIADFSPGDVFAQIANLTFDLSVHDIYLSFFHRGCLVPMSTAITKMASRYMDKLSVNHMMCVPSFYASMGAEEKIIPTLKNVFFLGEALRREVAKSSLKTFPNAKVFNLYGPTECTVAISYYVLNRNTLEEPIVPIGIALDSSTLAVSDSGELLLGGRQVFKGYINTSKDPFTVHNGETFYRSGDLCVFENGAYHFKGRVDFQIKYRGYRVELEGVEAILAAKLAGDFAAKPTNEIATNNYESLVVYYTNDKLTPADIINELPMHLRSALPEFLSAIPRTANGKINRKAL